MENRLIGVSLGANHKNKRIQACLAMLKYGITDIRTFYMTDLRCSKTFDRKEDNND